MCDRYPSGKKSSAVPIAFVSVSLLDAAGRNGTAIRADRRNHVIM